MPRRSRYISTGRYRPCRGLTKQDEESQQTSAENEEVLCLQALELYRTADTLVYRVFSHTLLH